MKSEASHHLCSLKSCSENLWKIPRKSFVMERILKALNYADISSVADVFP